MPIDTFSSEQAQANLRVNGAIYPDGRKNRNRIGRFTNCEPNTNFKFEKHDLIFTVGSCFARNIERKLFSLGFRLPTMEIEVPPEEMVSGVSNEILNKYTTAAIVNEFRWILGICEFPADGFIAVQNGLVCDPHLHPSLPPVSLERARARRAQIHALGTILPKCKVVIITLGLVEAWFDQQSGLYLNGAPPRTVLQSDPGRFSLRRQSYEDILADLESMYHILKMHGHPDFKMIVSVSPVPFKATYSGQDAIAANTYSKSALRAAAEKFTTNHDNVDYFPSYEMVVLSDRDAAYTDDNIHVRDDMVGRIMETAASRYVSGYRAAVSDGSPWAHLDNPYLLYQSAIKQISNGKFSNALEMLKHLDDAGLVAKAKVDPAEFYLKYGTVLARCGYAGLAEPYLARAVALLPNEPDPLFRLALMTARLRRREAITLFERVVKIAPNSTQYLNRLGLQYERERRTEQAIEAFSQVLTREPEHEGATDALIRIRNFLKLK